MHEQNILKDYLIKQEAEVTAMILTEYNEELREKTLREEDLEEGCKKIPETAVFVWFIGKPDGHSIFTFHK